MEEMRDNAVTRTMRADSELPNVVGEVAFFLGIPQPRSWQVLCTSGPHRSLSAPTVSIEKLSLFLFSVCLSKWQYVLLSVWRAWLSDARIWR